MYFNAAAALLLAPFRWVLGKGSQKADRIPVHEQHAWQRAVVDTNRLAQERPIVFGCIVAPAAGALAIAMAAWASQYSLVTQLVMGAVGALAGFVGGVGILALGMWVVAPVWQRDDARKDLLQAPTAAARAVQGAKEEERQASAKLESELQSKLAAAEAQLAKADEYFARRDRLVDLISELDRHRNMLSGIGIYLGKSIQFQTKGDKDAYIQRATNKAAERVQAGCAAIVSTLNEKGAEFNVDSHSSSFVVSYDLKFDPPPVTVMQKTILGLDAELEKIKGRLRNWSGPQWDRPA